MFPLAAFAQCPGCAAQRQIIAFGAAAGEDDFVWLTVEDPCYTFARVFNRLLGLTPKAMRRRAIAVNFAEVRQYCFQHARIRRRRRGMIKIDYSCHERCLSFALIAFFA